MDGDDDPRSTVNVGVGITSKTDSTVTHINELVYAAANVIITRFDGLFKKYIGRANNYVGLIGFFFFLLLEILF